MRACLKWPAILPWFILASALAVHADSGTAPAPPWAAADALQVVGQWRFAYGSAVSCDAIEVSATAEGTHRLVYGGTETTARPTAVHVLAWADHPGCTIRVSQDPVPANAPAPSAVPVDGLTPLAVPLPSAKPTEISLQEVPFELALPANARAVLVVRDDLAASAVSAVLPLLAAATKAEAPRIATLAWDTFSTLRAGSLDAARGRLEAARLQAVTGDRTRAIEQYRAVLDLAADLGSEHGSLASTSGYTRNRLLLDLAGEARRGLYGLVEAGGDAELSDLLPVADAMPRVPEQKRACARVAECLSKAGDHRGALVIPGTPY